MDHLNHKRYYWIKVILLATVLSFFVVQGVQAWTLNCSSPPSRIPSGGSFSISCQAHGDRCPWGTGQPHIRIYVSYIYRGTSHRRIPQGSDDIADCTGSYDCSGNVTSRTFSQSGWWVAEYCIWQQCGSLRAEVHCLPGEAFFVDPPRCGDGIVNQPSEQCDDGNNDPGDGCDANCQLEGPAPPPSTPTLPTGYDNPLRWNTILEFLSYILRMLFWVGVIILFFVLLIGAYYVITSGGSSTRILAAKKIFLWALVGFVIIILGRAIIWLIQHL